MYVGVGEIYIRWREDAFVIVEFKRNARIATLKCKCIVQVHARPAAQPTCSPGDEIALVWVNYP